MTDFFTPFITLTYTVIGPVMSLAYVPQAITVARDTTGAKSISLPTWGLWSFSALVTVLYSGFVVRDWRWCLSASSSLIGCCAVFFLAYHKRSQYQQLPERIQQ